MKQKAVSYVRSGCGKKQKLNEVKSSMYHMLEVVAVSQVFLKKKKKNLIFASILSSTASVLDFYDNIWSNVIKYN